MLDEGEGTRTHAVMQSAWSETSLDDLRMMRVATRHVNRSASTTLRMKKEAHLEATAPAANQVGERNADIVVHDLAVACEQSERASQQKRRSYSAGGWRNRPSGASS